MADVADRSALTGPERPKTADESVAATPAEEAELERVQDKFVLEGGAL